MENSEFMDDFVNKILIFWKDGKKTKKKKTALILKNKALKWNKLEYSPRSVKQHSLGKKFSQLFKNEKRFSLETVLSKSLTYYCLQLNLNQLSAVCEQFLSSKSVLDSTTKEGLLFYYFIYYYFYLLLFIIYFNIIFFLFLFLF